MKNLFKVVAYFLCLVCLSMVSFNVVNADVFQGLEEGVSDTYNAGETSSNSIFIRTWGAGGFAGERQGIADWIGYIISLLIMFLGVILLGMSIYAGSTWLLARGNPEKVDKAKEILRTSIIGVVILVFAYVVTSFILYLVNQSGGY